MKKSILSVAVLLSAIAISCGGDSHPKASNHCGSYELNASADTVNLIDLDCKKQGLWITKNVKGSKDTVYYKDGVAQ